MTEEADEALGRDGGPRHADAVALGEADETWPTIVGDAASGNLFGTTTAGGTGSRTSQGVTGCGIEARARASNVSGNSLTMTLCSSLVQSLFKELS